MYNQFFGHYLSETMAFVSRQVSNLPPDVDMDKLNPQEEEDNEPDIDMQREAWEEAYGQV